ncbi:MAG: helix-turn-helix transcriptional regulator [Rhizobiales bacterium]|nr:helix-turn-helix transcriptional regulator [Hyphomicrobiales bacterium]
MLPNMVFGAADAGLLGQAIDSVGSLRFCPALAAWLHCIVPFDHTVVFGYHGASKPIELYDDFPPDRRKIFVNDYVVGPYLLDPFYKGAMLPVEQGLYRLGDLAPDRFYQGEYFRTYYKRTEIAEEIGFFSAIGEGYQVVWSLMRKEKLFSAPAFRRLGQVAPVVVALIRKHWAKIANDRNLHDSPPAEIAGPGLERLTRRELEIVSYILRGHSSEATGQDLGISAGTVRIHRRNIYAKLEISSQRELFSRFLAGVSI